MNKKLFELYCGAIYDIGWYEALRENKVYKSHPEKSEIEINWMEDIRRKNELERQIKLELE